MSIHIANLQHLFRKSKYNFVTSQKIYFNEEENEISDCVGNMRHRL